MVANHYLLSRHAIQKEAESLQPEHVPSPFAEEYATCKACELRLLLDEGLTEFDQQLRQYARFLRLAELAMVRWGVDYPEPEFKAAFDRHADLVDALHSFAEALRVERAVLVTLYHVGDKYGTENRLRKGVMAHESATDSWWRWAQACGTELIDCFGRLASAHAALSGQDELSGVEAVEGNLVALFIRTGLQELTAVNETVRQRMHAFAEEVGPWLAVRRTAAFKVLGSVD